MIQNTDRTENPAMESRADIAKQREGSEPTRLISSDLSVEIVRAYRGWHRFEQENAGPSIVDFDLSDIDGEERFASRVSVLARLAELREDLRHEVSHEAEFLASRLTGSIAYLDALEGQDIPFPVYVEATLGLKPILFSAEKIRRARAELEVQLKLRKLRYDPSFKSAIEGRIFTDPNEIKQRIFSQKDMWLERLANTGVPVPREMPLAVKFDNVDAYWSNWIDGSSRHGITLTINLHERTRYDEARALFLCLHEICGHAVQMAIWRDRIQRGEISQACGVTNVHSPEMCIAEGLGQTVADLLDSYEYPSAFELNRSIRKYTLLLMHNAHIRLYNGISRETLLEELVEELPFSSKEELEAQLRERATDPLFRTYLLSYSTGENLIRDLVADHDFTKRRLFQAMYTIPMTPKQLIKFAR